MNDHQKIDAIRTTSYEGHMVTDDGCHALFRFGVHDAQITLAHPVEHLPAVLQSCAIALSGSAQQKMQSGDIPAFKADWWELGTTPEKDAILSLRLEGGGFLRFVLPNGMLAGLHETLGVMLGGAPKDPSPKTPLS